MKVGLGQTVVVEGIKMRCVVIKTDFSGDHYLLSYFHEGDLKCLEFAADELDVYEAKIETRKEATK